LKVCQKITATRLLPHL